MLTRDGILEIDVHVKHMRLEYPVGSLKHAHKLSLLGRRVFWLQQRMP